VSDSSSAGGATEAASNDDRSAGGVIRSSATMAAGTVVSRATGFLRDIVLIWAIGTHVFADTYNVANTVPNIIYILLVGGAINAVFVPQLVRAMRNDPDGGEAFANRLLTASGVVLLVITVAAVLAAPLIVGLYALAFTGADARAEFQVTTTFARFFLPQIFFYGLHVMLGQVLNARGRFGPMMWTPILNNLVVITTGLIFLIVTGGVKPEVETVSAGELRLLAIGTTLGVVVQALALLPYLKSVGMRFRPRFDWKGAGLGKSYRLARWTLLFVLVNQIAYLVVVQISTAVGKAAKTAGLETGVGFTPYTKAYLIMLLPHAIITVSVVTALLPRMSRAAADGRLAAVRDDISQGLRLTGVAMVPAAFAFLVLGPSLAIVMYARGATSVADAEYIGYVLSAFALGLVPFSAHHQLLRGFYAFEDTRTPVAINVWIAASHIGIALLCWWLLPLQWVVVGVAAGYSLSYVIGATLSARRLRSRLGGVDGHRVLRTYNRLILASVLAATPALVVSFLTSQFIGIGLLGSGVTILVGGGLMLGTFVVLARRMRIGELTELIGTVAGRFSRSHP
jgi:putative peptidoglycan lipid II flippase